jgi:hypothetical protein
LNTQDQLLEQITQCKTQLRDMFFQHYAESEVFSWVWWASIGIIVISFAVWWIVVEKKRLMEICLFGLIVNLWATFLDLMGTSYVLWEYPVHVLPQLPILIPIDYVIVPIIQMIIYQKCPNWKPYLIVATIAAAFQSFVAEPLAVLVGQYQLIKWRYIYSFPIYILISVTTKLFVEHLMARQIKQQSKP